MAKRQVDGPEPDTGPEAAQGNEPVPGQPSGIAAGRGSRSGRRREPVPEDPAEQAERFARAFARGGSVLVGGKVYTNPDDLPE